MKKQLLSLDLMRISIGVLFVWFGSLKFFEGLSPAEEIATKTICFISAGVLPPQTALLLLAIGEVGLGVLLLAGVWKKQVYILALLHMAGTFIPLIVFPHYCFTHAPYAFTLLGQYILKNLTLSAALWVLYQAHKNKTVQA